MIVKESDDANAMPGQGYTFIFYEYFHSLMEKKLEVIQLQELDSVFMLGEKDDLVIVTGHYSNTFS